MGDLLQLTVHEGTGLAGGFFNSRDPYVIIRMGAQKLHTTVMQNAGKNPKWEQTFSIPYEGEDQMSFTVMDKDTASKDDLMGEGRLDLGPLRAQKRYTTSVPIERKGKPAGTLRVSVYLKEASPQAGGGHGQQPPVYAVPLPYPVPSGPGFQHQQSGGFGGYPSGGYQGGYPPQHYGPPHGGPPHGGPPPHGGYGGNYGPPPHYPPPGGYHHPHY